MRLSSSQLDELCCSLISRAVYDGSEKNYNRLDKTLRALEKHGYNVKEYFEIRNEIYETLGVKR